MWAPEVHFYKGKYYLLATLHNSKTLLPYKHKDSLPLYNGQKAKPHVRGTQIMVAGGPKGPFVPVSDVAAPPAELMTLDGTLFVEDGVPYMVYAHEWIQLWDGTMEAVPLKADLTASTGRAVPVVQGVRRAVDRPHEEHGQAARLRDGRPVPLPHRDGQAADVVVELSGWALRGDAGDIDERQAARAVEAGRGAGGRRQWPRHAVRSVRWAADAGPASALPRALGKLFEMEDTGDTLRIKRRCRKRGPLKLRTVRSSAGLRMEQLNSSDIAC